ncbi:MAG: lamin tail domain-containing protein, partial [Planctomycetota bacterium]|nr:lamin tail domain-containing protein [Planctomycetota bacterium]
MRQSSRLAIAAGLAVGFGISAVHAAENGPIVITEIMYNPHGTDEGQEWVEIYNSSNAAVNLTGWYLENGHGATSLFPSGTSIAAHAVAVIVPRRGGVSGGGTDRGSTYVTTPANFTAAWGAGIQVIMVESFWNYYADPVPALATLNGLSNSPNGVSDALQIRDARNRLVDEVAYLDDEGTETSWPDDNDGG